ncbi:hypothetical protein TNIN_438071 [Trichonephila inaurata madagascariensis]|uniref:Uncharacterized protein n=1 Tax=Trichonephila inaurata madagascariensis TaxID=2747483 RepID=A0A8X7BQP5_9ARAC|nr:hypothetical protein TNIN_438071 [Trichonephila inaurata madagascariensis]
MCMLCVEIGNAAEEASAEAIATHEKTQKAFIKDDSLAQLILVGNMDDSNAELIAICDTAKSVGEKSNCVPDVSSIDIQNSDMEIMKKPLQTPDPDVEKEIYIEEISCSSEDREETLAEQA